MSLRQFNACMCGIASWSSSPEALAISTSSLYAKEKMSLLQESSAAKIAMKMDGKPADRRVLMTAPPRTFSSAPYKLLGIRPVSRHMLDMARTNHIPANNLVE